MTEKIKVILDTDIGTDIDDSLALAYLLNQPRCELIGVTTVTGEPDKRAAMVESICAYAEKNVPVFCGCDQPLEGIEQRQDIASQAKALEPEFASKQYPADTAVDYLRDTIRANPGEIVLLTIGPLTNIGRLFRDYPDVPGLLKAHYMMGCAFASIDKSEWNILLDPHAAAIVFNNPALITRVFGLNVTYRVTMSPEEARKRYCTGILKHIMGFADIFFEEQKRSIIYHDPLAAAAIFAPEICEMERGTVSVCTEPGERFGRTSFTAQPDGPHEVAMNVVPKRFFNEFFAYIMESELVKL